MVSDVEAGESAKVGRKKVRKRLFFLANLKKMCIFAATKCGDESSLFYCL
jgi:hypothetical protein